MKNIYFKAKWSAITTALILAISVAFAVILIASVYFLHLFFSFVISHNLQAVAFFSAMAIMIVLSSIPLWKDLYYYLTLNCAKKNDEV
jgi:Kef-type K+ transport system membrane component KefB